MADLVNVNVKIGGTTQTIRMEKGVTFENKGGIYAVDDNGQLKKFDKNANVWTDASRIEMTNYQWKAFQNVANNDGSSKTYTKADIEKAQELYRKGGFKADMSQDLPSGYKIEKPKLDSKQDYVQVDVTNGKPTQSATLKFQIQEIEELKAASQARESQTPAKVGGSPKEGNPAVSINDKGATVEPLIDYWDDSEYLYGYSVSKGNATSYYNKNKKLVGTVETLPDGKRKYLDKDGNCLYYMKGKKISSKETHRYIYDSNNKLKFIVKYDYNKQSVATSHQGMTYEEYGTNGEVVRRGTADHFPAGHTELDYFEPYNSEKGCYSFGSLYLRKK